MEGLPDDVFQNDMRTFPRDDPAVMAKHAAEVAKAQKAEEASIKRVKASKQKEEAYVQKVLESETQKHEKTSKTLALYRLKIKQYFAHFGDRLSIKAPKTLPNDEHALKELLDTIEAELCSKGGVGMAGDLFIAGAVATEQLNAMYNPFGLMLSGPAASLTSTLLKNKPQWDDLITEFAIANAEWFMVGPGKRMIGLLFKTAHAVDAANKMAVRMAQQAPPSQKGKEEEQEV